MDLYLELRLHRIKAKAIDQFGGEDTVTSEEKKKELREWWIKKFYLTAKAHFAALTEQESGGQPLIETEQRDKDRCMQVLLSHHEKCDNETHASSGIAYEDMTLDAGVLVDWIFENSYPGNFHGYKPLTAEQKGALATISREMLDNDNDQYQGPRELLALVEKFMHNVHGGVSPSYRPAPCRTAARRSRRWSR